MPQAWCALPFTLISLTNFRSRVNSPNAERLMPRLQAHPLIFSIPGPGMTVHQILALHVVEIRQTEFPQGQFKRSFMGIERIEINRDQNKITEISRVLTKIKDVVVIGFIGLKTEMGLQRRIQTANTI